MESPIKIFEKVSYNDFHVTPIMMDGKPIFLPEEIGPQMGYKDLNDSITSNKGLVKGVDYFVVAGDKLKQLKELLNSTTQNRRVHTPSLTLLTESGIIALSFRSDKKEFIQFRVWVTTEVIPSILKTGKYIMGSTSNPSLVTLESFIEAGKLLNVPPHLAQIEAVRETKKLTGTDYTSLLKLSLTSKKVGSEEEFYEPSDLGKKIGKSGKYVNEQLKNAGLQVKLNSVWEPTSVAISGVDYVRGSWTTAYKSGYNLRWNFNRVKKYLMDAHASSRTSGSTVSYKIDMVREEY